MSEAYLSRMLHMMQDPVHNMLHMMQDPVHNMLHMMQDPVHNMLQQEPQSPLQRNAGCRLGLGLGLGHQMPIRVRVRVRVRVRPPEQCRMPLHVMPHDAISTRHLRSLCTHDPCCPFPVPTISAAPVLPPTPAHPTLTGPALLTVHALMQRVPP